MTPPRFDVVLQLTLFDAYVKQARRLPSHAVSDAVKQLAAALVADNIPVGKACEELQLLASVFTTVSDDLGKFRVESANS